MRSGVVVVHSSPILSPEVVGHLAFSTIFVSVQPYVLPLVCKPLVPFYVTRMVGCIIDVERVRA